MRIDSHQHFWKASRGDYSWMSPSVPILCKDYLPDDLRPILAKTAIEKTVLVQAAQTIAETDFLLDIAHSCDFVAGVVGWLDMESPDFPVLFERYRANSKFIGLRPMLEEIADDAWIVRPAVIESLRLVAQARFPFDFLIWPQHLPHVLKALELVRGLHAVIDHIAKPDIKGRQMEPWKRWMAKAASHKNVWCKLSGMVNLADPQNWTPADLRPYVEHVVEQFGWDRVMFGSDWPVCRLAAEYEQVLDALEQILRPYLDKESEVKVFGANAARFYQLGSAAS